MAAPTVGKYELGKVLGAGDFDSRIRICTNTSTRKQYAVKIYDKRLLAATDWMWEQIRDGVHVMRTLPKHPNIIEMVECFETRESLFILMEMYSPQQLTKLYSESDIPMSTTRILFKQIVSGMVHMHENNVAHLGIAPDHILVNEATNEIKISFLNSCKTVAKGQMLTEMRGTTLTVAPEVLKEQPYDPFLADSWAVGCVLHFMLSRGRYPFDSANAIKNIMENRIRALNPYINQQARDLVNSLLQPNPTRRVRLSSVMAHPWMTMDIDDYSPQVVEERKWSVTSAHSWSVVESTFDESGLTITLPFGLSRENEAAYIIQHTWRMYRAQLNEPAVSRGDGTVRRVPSLKRLVPKVAKGFSSDTNPSRCHLCGRLPPSRVTRGKPLYPKTKLLFKDGKFENIVHTM